MYDFEIKANLLNHSVGFTDMAVSKLNKDMVNSLINDENHHGNKWVFISTANGIRIRMNYALNSDFVIDFDANLAYLTLKKDSKIILHNIKIEQPLVHAPEQLFLGLYEYCSVKCRFCPLAYSNEQKHYSLDSIYLDIENNINANIKSVGLTTSIPPNLSLEDLGDELCFVISKIKRKLPNIPIGVSTKCPSQRTLKNLLNAGAEEIRLNMELFDEQLASLIMPKKNIKEIQQSLIDSVEIFGYGKVSCNFIVGIGESDESVIQGIEWCCKRGIVPTLYPYDAIEFDTMSNKFSICNKFQSPEPARLINLAKEHYKLLKKYNMLSISLKTMCPACAASHIYPPTDMKGIKL